MTIKHVGLSWLLALAAFALAAALPLTSSAENEAEASQQTSTR